MCIRDSTKLFIEEFGREALNEMEHILSLIHICTDPDALKAYGSTIEEARADLFGLYYVADHKSVSYTHLDVYKRQAQLDKHCYSKDW